MEINGGSILRTGRHELTITKRSLILLLVMFICSILLTTTAQVVGCEKGIFHNGYYGITIDINSAPYTTFAGYSYGDNAYKENGCTWFASARLNQLTGKGHTIWTGKNWYNSEGEALGFSKGTTLSSTYKALACYQNHVSNHAAMIWKA